MYCVHRSSSSNKACRPFKRASELGDFVIYHVQVGLTAQLLRNMKNAGPSSQLPIDTCDELVEYRKAHKRP